MVAILTVVPALLLFLEYGMFTASTDYWVDNWYIAVSVLAFGLVLCVVNSILLVTISAYLQRIVPITITWASLFLLLGRLGDYLFNETKTPYWQLLDPCATCASSADYASARSSAKSTASSPGGRC